ncbi:MAG: cytochrome c oxidase subunit 2 [Alphaproteobacteria bacterium]|jgi:cytochrome c oxidase subunit 2
MQPKQQALTHIVAGTLGADGASSMIKSMRSWTFLGLTLGVLALLAGAAAAQVGGQPVAGQIGLQQAATPVMEEIHTFYDWVNYIIIAITIFVMVLMAVVMIRFNRKSNPNPSTTTHNTFIEVVWTVVPVLILVFIGIFSFKLLFLQYQYPKPDLTIKATGNAWFWEHTYQDHDGATVTSNMLTDADMLKAKIGDDKFEAQYGNLEDTALSQALYKAAKPLWAERKLSRQLAVDNEIAVPVNAVVHMLVTSNDVIHGWTIPAFGSKTQAVPGRITATWFKPTKLGVFYGQCSVLCGLKHSAMPIAIRVVEQGVFDRWMAAVKADKMEDAGKILASAGNGDANKKIAKAKAGATAK